MYFVNSTIYVEDAEGEVIGEVRQRFHLWQRNYDIYLDRRQIAVINSPLLAWEFAIKDANGGGHAIIPAALQALKILNFTLSVLVVERRRMQYTVEALLPCLPYVVPIK